VAYFRDRRTINVYIWCKCTDLLPCLRFLTSCISFLNCFRNNNVKNRTCFLLLLLMPYGRAEPTRRAVHIWIQWEPCTRVLATKQALKASFENKLWKEALKFKLTFLSPPKLSHWMFFVFFCFFQWSEPIPQAVHMAAFRLGQLMLSGSFARRMKSYLNNAGGGTWHGKRMSQRWQALPKHFQRRFFCNTCVLKVAPSRVLGICTIS